MERNNKGMNFELEINKKYCNLSIKFINMKALPC